MFNHFDRFHLDPKLFPESTRKAFPTAVMIKFGALPLGFKTGFSFFRKRRALNVGLLNPKKTNLKALETLAKEALGKDSFVRMNIFKIDPEEFVQILEAAYGLKRGALHLMKEEDTHPFLKSVLGSEQGVDGRMDS